MWGNVGYRHSTYFRFMNFIGFTYADHNPDSWEGWHWGGMHMWGFSWRLGNPEQYNLLEDGLKHAEMIVFWSADPETNGGIYSAHESTIRRKWLKELGVKMVFIDPHYNHTAGLIGDKWFSPKIGTDHALSFAIAYTWLIEGTYDKEYVATHAYGFEEWSEYVLGKTDGVPKTCEWAESECGVPACEIRALAREWAKRKTYLAAGGLGGWGGACRASHGIEWARGMIALATMQGMGKPGSNIWSTTQGAPVDDEFYFPGYADGGISGDCENSAAGYKFAWRMFDGKTSSPVVVEHQHQRRPAHPAPEGARVHHGRQVRVERQGLLPAGHPAPVAPVPVSGSGLPEDPHAVEVRRTVDRHHDGHQPLRQDVHRSEPGVRGQPVDLVRRRSAVRRYHPAGLHQLRALGHLGVLQLLGLHSATTYSQVNHRIISLQTKCIEPVGESKSDYQIYALLAKKLGIEGPFTEGKDELGWIEQYYNATDMPKYMPFAEFKKKGYFVVPDNPEPQQERGVALVCRRPAQRHARLGPASKQPDCL